MKTNSSDVKKLDRKDLMGVFWRSWRQDAVWNFERQQNLGSAYTMSRVVGKLYADDPENVPAHYRDMWNLWRLLHIYQHYYMEF